MSNPQHSSVSQDWGTPPECVDAVKAALGGTIDLDPCSNPARTLARVNFPVGGLEEDWTPYASIYCNPPGGKVQGKSSAGLWWAKFVASTNDELPGVYAVFNLNTLQTLQRYAPLDGSMVCVPSKRVRWVKDSAKSPPNGSAFLYRGPDPERFRTAFGKFGAVLGGR